MQIVVGLGNPGEDTGTRGTTSAFACWTAWRRTRAPIHRVDGELGRRAWTTESTDAAGRTVVLAKPRTYMNRSGRAAAALCRRYDVAADQLIVVYDDADLALGRVRLRPDGGSGGHNGIRSIAESLGSGGFRRVRLGVRGAGREDRELADYVLDEFERLGGRGAADLVVEALDRVGCAMSRQRPASRGISDGVETRRRNEDSSTGATVKLPRTAETSERKGLVEVNPRIQLAVYRTHRELFAWSSE